MALQAIDDKIERFLERKFRASRSFSTKSAYRGAIAKFSEFTRITYNLDLGQLLRAIKETREKDALDSLDDFYTYLSKAKKTSSQNKGFSNSTIRNYVIMAKEFLNYEGCHIYNEDLKLKFRLPKKEVVYEQGLTKDVISRLVRLSNPKLSCIILMACSSGMRIGEVIQLRLADVDFTTNPTTITIRREITKTKQTRITHLTHEATLALQDFLRKYHNWRENENDNRYIFLQTIEDKINLIKEKSSMGNQENMLYQNRYRHRIEYLQQRLGKFGQEEAYSMSVSNTKQSYESQLRKVIKKIPELSTKNDNGRNAIHFHAFRAWFKTQVTNYHQSDYAEALMGHTSLKLVYYRQNDEQRAKIYRELEPVLTISDTSKIEKSFDILQEENHDLKKIVEALSIQLRNLEKRIERK